MKKLLITLGLLASTSAFARVGYLEHHCYDQRGNFEYKYWAFSNGNSILNVNSYEVTMPIDQLDDVALKIIDLFADGTGPAATRTYRSFRTPGVILGEVVYGDNPDYPNMSFKMTRSTFSYSRVHCDTFHQ